jgi:Raf kinase inhibitor-like YbhB/YbcL family protein
MVFRLESSAFRADGPIPKQYTGEGRDISPPLAWSGAPPATRELALIVDDPDAPRERPWVHWVLYRIPAGASAIAEGGNAGALEGPNDFGRSGWGGPMPPLGHGVHHYHFKLYALDRPLGLGAGAAKDQVLAAMQGRVIDQTELVGTYERAAAGARR